MSRRRATLLASFATVLALLLALLGAPGPAGADPSNPPAPPVPTNTSDAQAAARAAAARVAHLQGRMRRQLNTVAAASNAADLADTRYHQQLKVQHKARRAAVAAAGVAQRAEVAYEAAQRDLARLMAIEYETGGTAADAGALLTADDPSQVLQLADTQAQLGQYSAMLVQRAQTTKDASDAANAERQRTLAAERVATASLKRLRNLAATRYAQAQHQLKKLRNQLVGAQTSQHAADAVLSLFLGGWSMADPARAAALNAQYLAIARQFKNEPLAPRSDHWTQAMADSAVHRALQFIGTPYAWAGGNGVGPTRGVCASGAAHNDCHITGFDCSGLVLYSWAPYRSLAHYAATQWASGRIHPSPADLLPGDMLFWSSDGKVDGIHHVAMYVGDGNVIQAPESGDVVRITPMANVSSGYFGATRPMS